MTKQEIISKLKEILNADYGGDWTNDYLKGINEGLWFIGQLDEPSQESCEYCSDSKRIGYSFFTEKAFFTCEGKFCPNCGRKLSLKTNFAEKVKPPF